MVGDVGFYFFGGCLRFGCGAVVFLNPVTTCLLKDFDMAITRWDPSFEGF